jgi:4-amino-4-deoxy-L-arabinose transferase-like glycosyltransferase
MPKRGLGILAALILLILALLVLRGEATGPGLALGLAGLVLFIISLRSIERTPPPEDPKPPVNVRPLALPLILWGTGLIATLFVVLNVITTPKTADEGRLVAAAWVSSVILHISGTLTAVRWRPPSATSIAASFRANRSEILLAGGLALAALVLRVAGLAAHPYPWSGDEAAIGNEGVRILQGEATTFFGTGWSGQPVWSFLPTALTVAIFGNTIFAARIVSALAGALTVPALYLFGRMLFNRDVGFLSAVALIAYPYHLQFSRLGVNNVNDGLVAVFVLGLSYFALKRGSIATFTLTGVAIGLSIYTYVGSRLVVVLAGFMFLFVAATRRGWLQAHVGHQAALVAGAAVTALPMAIFFLRNPQVFMTRINQTGIIQNGWLAGRLAEGEDSIWQIWLSQFSRSTLVYIAKPALSNFLNFDRPYLTVIGGVFFLLGVAYAFYRFRALPYLIVLIWFWSVVILGSVLTVDPPANTRMVMAIPPTALFVGIGLQKILDALPRAGVVPPAFARIICGVLAGIIAVQGAIFYFGKYRTAAMFSDANSEVATRIAQQLQVLGPDYRLYLLGAPQVFASFPTISYIDPASPLVDLEDARPETLAGIDRQHGLFFVAIPAQKDNLTAIAGLIQGGEWQTLQRRSRAEVLYYAYIVPPP